MMKNSIGALLGAAGIAASSTADAYVYYDLEATRLTPLSGERLRELFPTGSHRGILRVVRDNVDCPERMRTNDEKCPEERAHVVVGYHVVERGQTLSDLAREVYGSNADWTLLAHQNKIRNHNDIKPGQIVVYTNVCNRTSYKLLFAMGPIEVPRKASIDGLF